MTTQQFRNTTIRLMRDVCAGLGRDHKDGAFVGGFIVPMVGSLGHECGGFLKMEEGKPTVAGSLGGISFAQWTGMKPPRGRRLLFMNFCRAHKLHPYGYDAAVGFLIHELTTTARNVVDRTLKAGPIPGFANPALYGRVIMFERLYEGAGVKHYESRYENAMRAAQVIKEWAQAGMPEPGKFIMPKSRFSAKFDAEFGTGLSETTGRWDHLQLGDDHVRIAPSENPQARPLPDGRVILPDGRIEDRDPATGKITMANPTVRRGRWPEQFLTAAEIAAIQKRMRDMGYVSVGMIDGKWNPRMIGAISAMQAENGIRPDGHYGPATRKALSDGRKHVISMIRATATRKALLAAGEPTLAAVQPVSITSTALTVISGLGTVVVGVASMWPQASTIVDGMKSTLGFLPPWLWPLIVFLVALFLAIRSNKVQSVAVNNFRTGASTALAVPPIDLKELSEGVLPGVPDPDGDQPSESMWLDKDNIPRPMVSISPAMTLDKLNQMVAGGDYSQLSQNDILNMVSESARQQTEAVDPDSLDSEDERPISDDVPVDHMATAAGYDSLNDMQHPVGSEQWAYTVSYGAKP